MVHLRINERESNPNPHINFITQLPVSHEGSQENARQLLRALAAQVRPVMKAHGFTVNSLEEYEYNSVFAGRNWNNGEVVELVLRRKNGSFVPTSYLISTFLHELAHIQHMNHGPSFQALWATLRREVRDLQNKGYYGDGYWSSGTRLADEAHVSGDSASVEDLPEYMCGGAHPRARPTRSRRHRGPQSRQAGPSNHTGAQTAKKRKPGARVKSAGTFLGGGQAVGEGSGGGTGFGKKAGSKRAREERALAAERRIRAVQIPEGSRISEDDPDSVDSDSEVEVIPETDQERRLAMGEEEMSSENKNTSWDRFMDEFRIPASDCQPSKPVMSLSKLSGHRSQESSGSVSTQTTSAFAAVGPKQQRGNGKARASDAQASSHPAKRPKTTQATASKDHDLEEIEQKETLHLTSPGGTQDLKVSDEKWECSVCTLLNKPLYLICEVCNTSRDST